MHVPFRMHYRNNLIAVTVISFTPLILTDLSVNKFWQNLVLLLLQAESDAREFTVFSLNVPATCPADSPIITGTCFIQKMYAPVSSLLQGKHLPFSPSPLRLNIFRLFVILSLTQLYRYTPEIFLFSTATFKYTYRAPLRQIGQE